MNFTNVAQICSYIQVNYCNNVFRLFSTKISPNLKTSASVDMIGPPDPVSNLRPMIFAKFENESNLEKRYRKAREDTQLWNQNFWYKHNSRFAKLRKQYQETLKNQGRTINADDMSVFYKEFLDKNWQTHINYNIAWYKRNINLLFLEIRQTSSRYISWNILFLWGIGLWIALCTNNMYYSSMLNEEAALFYLHTNFGIMYNISAKTEDIEDVIQIVATNSTLCNVLLMLKAIVQYIHVLVYVTFVMLFICLHKYTKGAPKVWKNLAHTSCNIVLYLTTFTKSYRQIIFNKISPKTDCSALQYNVITKSEISAQCVEQELAADCKEEYALNGKMKRNMLNTESNTVQMEIIFNSYTFLFFNSYDLHQYFNNRQLKNALLSKYLIDQNSKYMDSNIFPNNWKFNGYPLSKKSIKKGIVSSSPEFQQFLTNLQCSRLFYPCMLEVSTSYVIRIKSIYE